MSTAAPREVVAVFQSQANLQGAIDEVLSSGFNRAALSLLATEQVARDRLGAVIKDVRALEHDPTAPRTAYVAPESVGDAQGLLIGGFAYIGAMAASGAVVASGGALAGMIAAAVLAGGAGGLFGEALAHALGASRAQAVQAQLDRGGLILWVRAFSPEEETRAVEILTRHGADDVHVQSFQTE
jgi:hypothetical protein